MPPTPDLPSPGQTAPDVIERAMRHALSLAAHGPATGPQANVGCVLLDAAGEIAAEGWHRGPGTPHAEVDALSKLAPGAARGLTAVVTLEPCNHWGRTGPCSEALIEAGIGRVVFSVEDPGEVSGGGKERLAAAGIPVDEGVLEPEVSSSMRRWLTAVRRGRPFVTVKWASSLDGRAAAADGTSQWITGTAARQHVHEQRSAHDAILVGTGTVLADDPSLTARGDAGELLRDQPVPVIVGERAIPAGHRILNHPRDAIVTGTRDLEAVLVHLHARDVRTVLVEGGPTVASEMLRLGLADDVLVYLAPTLLGGPGVALGDLGVASIDEQQRLAVTSVTALGDDLAILARVVRGEHPTIESTT